ncbi:MAG: peptide deformylase [Clostridia bacterium]|nr:peptide deformylase [Clostridia bacterium]
MQRTIVRDQFRLMQPSRPAEKKDLALAQDLLDTLLANRERCVGLAANMIGENVRVIVYMDGVLPNVMLNPVIVKKDGPYETEEGCLSLPGRRKTTRYQTITVQWQDRQMKKKTGTFRDYTAQIIQHEIDHCNGIVI